jgi:hypothetical protein
MIASAILAVFQVLKSFCVAGFLRFLEENAAEKPERCGKFKS